PPPRGRDHDARRDVRRSTRPPPEPPEQLPRSGRHHPPRVERPRTGVRARALGGPYVVARLGNRRGGAPPRVRLLMSAPADAASVYPDAPRGPGRRARGDGGDADGRAPPAADSPAPRDVDAPRGGVDRGALADRAGRRARVGRGDRRDAF